MDGIFSAWTSWRRARWIVIVAILYAALLLPFKPLVVLPGFTELRPANFIPALAGVLIGPAGAWGSAFGNLIADMIGGTLTAGSLFGFIANFLFAYVAWRIWELMREPDKTGVDAHVLGVFALAGLAGSAVCALVIGLGLFALGLQPLPQALFLVMFITFNNFIPTLLFGSAGLWILDARLKV